MPTLIYPLSSLVGRLSSVAEIRLLGVAPDLAAVLETPPRAVPAVYLGTSSTGGKLQYTGPLHQQDRETTVHTVIWVRNAGGPAAVLKDMETVEQAVEARLAGYTPGDAFGSLLFSEAKDEFTRADYYVRQLAYTSQWMFSTSVQT